MISDNLMLNDDKTEFLILGKKQQLAKQPACENSESVMNAFKRINLGLCNAFFYSLRICLACGICISQVIPILYLCN